MRIPGHGKPSTGGGKESKEKGPRIQQRQGPRIPGFKDSSAKEQKSEVQKSEVQKSEEQKSKRAKRGRGFKGKQQQSPRDG